MQSPFENIEIDICVAAGAAAVAVLHGTKKILELYFVRPSKGI